MNKKPNVSEDTTLVADANEQFLPSTDESNLAEQIDLIDSRKSMFKEYTAEVIKLEKGDFIKGVLHRQTFDLPSTQKTGEFYKVVKVTIKDDDGDLKSVYLGGEVILGAHDRIFETSMHANNGAALVIIKGKGERESKTGKTYNDYSVFAY